MGVGTATPDASAVLDIVSPNKGMLPPRTDTATVNSSSTPAAGLFIYQTTDNQYYYFDGIKWVQFVTTTYIPPQIKSTHIATVASW